MSSNNTLYELIKFKIGGNEWNYTSTNEEVSYNGDLYQPEIMKVGSVKIAGDFFKTALDIKLDSKNEFSRQWISGTPDIKVEVTVYRYNPNTDTAITFFTGEVLDVKINQIESNISCNQVSQKMTKQMMTNYYQRSCRHVLYSDTGCRLNRVPFTINGTITSIVGNVIIVSGVTSTDPDYYQAGEVIVGQERKTISGYNTTTKELTLFKAMVDAKVGDSASVYAGCDHTPETCLNEKNNIINFGGHSFIPEKNPLTKLI